MHISAHLSLTYKRALGNILIAFFKTFSDTKSLFLSKCEIGFKTNVPVIMLCQVYFARSHHEQGHADKKTNENILIPGMGVDARTKSVICHIKILTIHPCKSPNNFRDTFSHKRQCLKLFVEAMTKKQTQQFYFKYSFFILPL